MQYILDPQYTSRTLRDRARRLIFRLFPFPQLEYSSVDIIESPPDTFEEWASQVEPPDILKGYAEVVLAGGTAPGRYALVQKKDGSLTVYPDWKVWLEQATPKNLRDLDFCYRVYRVAVESTLVGLHLPVLDLTPLHDAALCFMGSRIINEPAVLQLYRKFLDLAKDDEELGAMQQILQAASLPPPHRLPDRTPSQKRALHRESAARSKARRHRIMRYEEYVKTFGNHADAAKEVLMAVEDSRRLPKDRKRYLLRELPKDFKKKR